MSRQFLSCPIEVLERHEVLKKQAGHDQSIIRPIGSHGDERFMAYNSPAYHSAAGRTKHPALLIAGC